MALTITEHWESGSGELGKDSGDTYVAIVSSDITNPALMGSDGADSEYTVSIFAAQSFSLLSACNNVLNNISRERIAPFTWKFTAVYKSITQDRQTNAASFSFTTGGGTQHITHTRKTVAQYAAPGKTAPNTKGGIGATATSVEGVDIHTPSFDFKTTFYVQPKYMTSAYMQSLKTLAARVNSDEVTIVVNGITVGTFAPGELLFLGADGSERVGFADWELTLNWSSSPNVSNQKIGDITVAQKNGWDYLWVAYDAAADTTALVQVQNPIAVYIEQVYDYQPLTPLIPQNAFGPVSQTNAQPWTSPASPSGAGVK